MQSRNYFEGWEGGGRGGCVARAHPRATPQLIPLFGNGLRPLDPFVVMLYWSLDLDLFGDQ